MLSSGRLQNPAWSVLSPSAAGPGREPGQPDQVCQRPTPCGSPPCPARRRCGARQRCRRQAAPRRRPPARRGASSGRGSLPGPSLGKALFLQRQVAKVFARVAAHPAAAGCWRANSFGAGEVWRTCAQAFGLYPRVLAKAAAYHASTPVATACRARRSSIPFVPPLMRRVMRRKSPTSASLFNPLSSQKSAADSAAHWGWARRWG